MQLYAEKYNSAILDTDAILVYVVQLFTTGVQ